MPLINHSKKEVQFTIELDDHHERGLSFNLMVMNQKGVHEVTLKGKQKKVVKIVSEIDVSELDSYISGSSNSIGIILKSGRRSREL
ncbi:hypothetical protein [Alkalihalobacterium sp. APHAB7]|uniref:hypothetical protein n=1 Tax=Alkalihalobacterium sp. APHAB7 TaxID=3402081 RepID=UPI003AAE6085